MRKLHFCAGHRVLGHENKCATPHGHNYFIFLTAEADELDHLGRIIDFSVLKEKMGGWIEQHWDHTFLIYEKDEALIAALNSVAAQKAPYICPFNPTAENMADYLLTKIAPRLFHETPVRITKVIVQETDNCFAEASLN